MERLRRRWWTVAVTTAASLVVLGALLTGGFQLVMMMVPGYRADIANYVSRVAGQAVEIGGVGLGWSGLAPRLDLTDITLYGEDGHTPALSAGRLRLGFGPLRLMQGDTTPTRIELSGLQLFARIDAEGQFSLRGLDTGGGPSSVAQDWLRHLGRFHRVSLRQCDLVLADARLRGPDRRFRLTEAEIVFEDGRGSAQAEIELPRAIGSRVLASAAIVGDLSQPATWNGEWSAIVEGLTGIPWLDAYLGRDAELGVRGGELSMQGELREGAMGPAQLALRADALVGRRNGRETQLSEVEVRARLVREGMRWTLDVDRLAMLGPGGRWPQTGLRIVGTSNPAGDRSIDLSVPYLSLTDLAPWLDLIGNEGLHARLEPVQGMAGVVRGLVMRWQSSQADSSRFSLRADLDDVALAQQGDRPGIEGLSGELSTTERSGRLRLREQPATVRVSRIIGSPVEFQQLSGELGWERTAEGWQLRVPQFGWALAGSQGQGQLDLFFPLEAGTSPRIRLDARFSAASALPLKPFMPLFWAANFRDWLGTAIVAGRAPSGHLRIEGPLADFPFVEKPGLFALDLDVADARFAYAPDWPEGEKLAARLEFRGRSLMIRGSQGWVSGNRLEGFEARIENFAEPLLTVTGEAQGDAARFYDFLRASPLATTLSGLLERTRAQGEAAVRFDLSVPLRAPKDTQVRGTARLNAVQLDVLNVPEPVRAITGELHFDNQGARAEGLQARMYDTPLTTSLSSEADRVHVVRAAFEFTPDAAGSGLSALVPSFLRGKMNGRSQWTARLALNGPRGGVVELASDLQGLALRLPLPMQKSADAIWPTRLELGRGERVPLRLGLEIAERAGMDLVFDSNGETGLSLRRGQVRVGVGQPPLAENDGLFVTGTVEDLAPLLWVEAVKSETPVSGPGTGAALPLSVDVNVGHLWMGGQSVQGVRLQHLPAAGGWLTRLSGNGAQGELGFQNSIDGGRLTGRFRHLNLAYRGLSGQDGSPAVETASVAPERASRAPIDPSTLPSLDLLVDQLQLGNADLGRLELRTSRIAHGQRIERLQTTGAGAQVEASGNWRRIDARSAASLALTLRSESIGEVLKGLGYAPNLSARKSRFDIQLDWPEGAANSGAGLELAQGRGRMELDIDKGALKAVEPGAGRVLGLINFWAIPRRLTLDFGDVVSKGLSFDQIKGSFVVADGMARTDDLLIDAPSLNMEVRGRVGLAARDYDQRITVYPDVSAGITLGALLIGGPAAGALALIAQEVLDQPLDQVGQLSYRLTGSWDDPQVVRASEAQSPTPAPAPTPKPGPAR